MSKNKLNAHLTQSLKESIYKIMEEESTSARNLEQFRARQDSNRAERQARGQEINAAKRERTAQINAKTAELGSRDKAMDTLSKSADFQRLSGTASRGQGQQNTFGGENQRTETSSGVSRMARGADGRPVSSYVNRNSPQGRVDADVKSGKLPASFGEYQGNRLPMDLAKERENAGNAAFDASVNTNLDIENASGMNRSDLESKAKDVVAQRTLNIDHKLRGDDIQKNDQMPTDAVGSKSQAATAPKPTGSTPSASFADAVNGVRQSSTSSPRPSPNIPQDRNDGRNDVKNFNGIPKPVRREVIPARNPRSTNSMRDFDLYGPLK